MATADLILEVDDGMDGRRMVHGVFRRVLALLLDVCDDLRRVRDSLYASQVEYSSGHRPGIRSVATIFFPTCIDSPCFVASLAAVLTIMQKTATSTVRQRKRIVSILRVVEF